MNDLKAKKEKKWKYLIFITISILCSLFFSIPANAAAGDLILDTQVLLPFNYPPGRTALATPLATTLLKEEYSLSLDDVNFDIRSVNFTIYKNKEIVKKMNVKDGDYFYYNKNIGGTEYKIIESKLNGIFSGATYDMVQLKPFYQYSDGSNIIEPDFVSANLDPKIPGAPYEKWNRRFGGIYDDNVWSVQQTSDGGYILGLTIGSENPYGFTMYPMYIPLLIKVDGNGNERFEKTFGDIGYIPSGSYFSDGDYVFTGIKPDERRPIRLVKIDVNGNQQWNRTLGKNGDHSFSSVQNTSDGGYILAGRIWPAGSDPRDAILVKTNSHGSELWSKTFRLDGVITPSFVQETPDGGYILTGDLLWDEHDNFRMDEVLLLKTDSKGTELWNRTFGGADNNRAYSVLNTLDGGYILAGMTQSYGTEGDAWLLKTDANGIEQWNRTFGLDGFDGVYSVVQTSDGGYVLAGMIDTARNPDFKGQIHYTNHDAWLFKTDANGDLEWSRTFGGLKRDEARFVQETKDGGFIIAGTTESYGSKGSDIWLIKVSGEPEGTGNISVGSQTGTGNTKRNITGISNRTETLSSRPKQAQTAVPTGTNTVKSLKKTAGFEVALAITILLAVYASGRKRR